MSQNALPVNHVNRFAITATAQVVRTLWQAVATVVAVVSEARLLLQPKDENFEVAEFSRRSLVSGFGCEFATLCLVFAIHLLVMNRVPAKFTNLCVLVDHLLCLSTNSLCWSTKIVQTFIRKSGSLTSDGKSCSKRSSARSSKSSEF